VGVRVEATDTPFTQLCAPGQVLSLPIAHGEGNYFADMDVLRRLDERRQVVFRYCSPEGEVTAQANPNGSLRNIAGICSDERNVVGLMPHPERACEHALGSADGLVLFDSVVASLTHAGTLPAGT
jgi:phosphoribosylformylglycinamidine synthase